MPFLLMVFLTLACLPAVHRTEVGWPDPTWSGSSVWLSALLSGGGEAASGDGVGKHTRPVLAVALSDDIKLFAGRLALHPAVRVEKIDRSDGKVELSLA